MESFAFHGQVATFHQLPDHITLKKHCLLVWPAIFSAMGCFYSAMAWYFDFTTSFLWNLWLSHFILAFSVAATPIAIYASVKLTYASVTAYALMATLELSCKLYFISTIIERKRLLRRNCSEYYHPSHECDTWALQDLTLSDNLTFQLISSVSQIVLIFFSIQLCYFIRQENSAVLLSKKHRHHHRHDQRHRSHHHHHNQHHHGQDEEQQQNQQQQQQQLSQQHSARYSTFSESTSLESSYGTFLRMERRKSSAVYLSTPL